MDLSRGVVDLFNGVVDLFSGVLDREERSTLGDLITTLDSEDGESPRNPLILPRPVVKSNGNKGIDGRSKFEVEPSKVVFGVEDR